jgi:hypothetical protein
MTKREHTWLCELLKYMIQTNAMPMPHAMPFKVMAPNAIKTNH